MDEQTAVDTWPASDADPSQPARYACPSCGRTYPEDGSCSYGHPNASGLNPIAGAPGVEPPQDTVAHLPVEGSPADAVADARTGEGTATDADAPAPADVAAGEVPHVKCPNCGAVFGPTWDDVVTPNADEPDAEPDVDPANGTQVVPPAGT